MNITKTQRITTSLAGSITLLCGAFGSAQAGIDAYILNDEGVTQARTFVQYGSSWNPTFEMTDSGGRITIPSNDSTATARVYAHNPVVRMVRDNGLNLFERFLYEEVNLFDGINRVDDEAFVIAEKLRSMYEHGFRDFSPWRNRVFPNSSSRTSNAYIEVAYPSSLAMMAWVEPAGVLTSHPVIHLTETYYEDRVLVHELAHALHFSQLSRDKRLEVQSTYANWLATDLLGGGTATHNFSKATTPFVAYIEAFGHFAETYWSVRNESDREQAFFDTRILDEAQNFFDDERDAWVRTWNECTPVSGDDVEGAIYCALFHDFAGKENVGLDYVVTTYVQCESLDIHEYASCIATLEGYGSSKYRSLYEATAEHGITIPMPRFTPIPIRYMPVVR